jgi:hypothetical protein
MLPRWWYTLEIEYHPRAAYPYRPESASMEVAERVVVRRRDHAPRVVKDLPHRPDSVGRVPPYRAAVPQASRHRIRQRQQGVNRGAERPRPRNRDQHRRTDSAARFDTDRRQC